MGLKDLLNSLGFGNKCLNNGNRVNGVCRCAEYFTGKLCEKIVCMNDGVPAADGSACICPNANVRGRFCETLYCENGGTDTRLGHCKCIHDWYSGRYCQTYSTPWGIVLAIGIGIVAFLAGICFICRLDLFQSLCLQQSSDRSDSNDDLDSPRRRRRRRRNHAMPATQPLQSGQSDPHRMLTLHDIGPPLPIDALDYVKPPDYSPESPPPPYEIAIRTAASDVTSDQPAAQLYSLPQQELRPPNSTNNTNTTTVTIGPTEAIT